jgi:uncharacterized membrane protein YadS
MQWRYQFWGEVLLCVGLAVGSSWSFGGSDVARSGSSGGGLAPVPGAFQTGMATKLLRVVFLAPVVALLPRILHRSHPSPSEANTGEHANPPVLPWYVAGFLVAGLVMTFTGYLPSSFQGALNLTAARLVQPTNLLIGASMAAIGLQVDFAVLRKHGPKLIVTAGLAWLALFMVVLVLCLIWK